MKRQLATLLVVLAVTATAGLYFTTRASAAPLIRVAGLRGATEVPGPGDADGSGSARIELYMGQQKVCYRVTFTRITTRTAAHIHQGAAGVAGNIRLTLFNGNKTSPFSLCRTGVSLTLMRALRDQPQNFYVNVHTTAFPNGAIRGQLRTPA